MATTLPLTRKAISQRIFRTRAEDKLPLKVEHQRIYIVPSRRGWAFLLALMICLVASVNYQLNLGYALSFLLAGLFAASLLNTYKNLAGLHLDSLQAPTTTCGEPAKFLLRMSNATRHDRIGIDVRHADTSARCDLPTDKQTIAELNIPTTQRGYQRLGRLTLTSQYPLGLWTTWSYCHTDAQVLVHPRAEAQPPPLPRAYDDGDADSLQAGVEGDVANLRDYQPGDPLTRVAWKRAARGAGLHVRELEENNPGGDIELSIAATDCHDVEAQVSRLCAWVNEAHQAGSAYSLTLDSNHLANNSGDAHRTACLDALALYKNVSTENKP